MALWRLDAGRLAPGCQGKVLGLDAFSGNASNRRRLRGMAHPNHVRAPVLLPAAASGVSVQGLLAASTIRIRLAPASGTLDRK